MPEVKSMTHWIDVIDLPPFPVRLWQIIILVAPNELHILIPKPFVDSSNTNSGLGLWLV